MPHHCDDCWAKDREGSMIIDSKMETLPGVMLNPEPFQLKNEPMLFNCDLAAAERLGGAITWNFIDLLPEEWRLSDIVVDSRVHMLMSGWYPCIPGWHHDDVPRTRPDGQPNYTPGQFRSEHIMALVNGDICPTLFALGKGRFIEPAPGAIVYKHFHHQVEGMLMDGELDPVSAPSNRLIRFDDRTWHRGTKAVANGWRFFIRASRYFAPDGTPVPRGNPRTNEVRRQVQVYMDSVNAGW